MNVVLSLGDQTGHLRIARTLTGSKDFRADAFAISVYHRDEDEVRLLCIAVLDNRAGDMADMHFVAVDDAWRAHLREIANFFFTFVFGHTGSALGLSRLRAPIASTNTSAQVVALKSGFEFEARLRASAANGSDVILMVLEPDKCRWLQDATQADAA